MRLSKLGFSSNLSDYLRSMRVEEAKVNKNKYICDICCKEFSEGEMIHENKYGEYLCDYCNSEYDTKTY